MILAFGASASKNSINKALAHYTAKQFEGHELDLIDLLDFSVPLYTVDLEKEQGFPASVLQLKEKIDRAELIVISLAEHNGSYTAWFKNLFDWLSRLESKFLQDKKVFLLATSPGARGGQTVLDTAIERFPRHGAHILESFSLPNFNHNFTSENGIVHAELKDEFSVKCAKARAALQ
jgi:chromate reductase, NAD(P)H dehydrogenase (quinone)